MRRAGAHAASPFRWADLPSVGQNPFVRQSQPLGFASKGSLAPKVLKPASKVRRVGEQRPPDASPTPAPGVDRRDRGTASLQACQHLWPTKMPMWYLPFRSSL